MAKPFFTDMWDAITLASKHASYSSVKYYNIELDNVNTVDEKVLIDLLDDARKSIHRSLNKLDEIKRIKDPLKDIQGIDTVGKTTIDATMCVFS